MRNYKSSLGRTVDMNALIAKNESVRAVGNMKVNARGDTIDSFGRIIKPATDKVVEQYSKTVNNASAHGKKVMPKNSSGQSEENIEYTQELNDVFEQDQIDIETIKKNDNKNQ
jgi:hypothetical protein